MYNHTGLQGRLTADPELRHTPSGVAITSGRTPAMPSAHSMTLPTASPPPASASGGRAMSTRPDSSQYATAPISPKQAQRTPMGSSGASVVRPRTSSRPAIETNVPPTVSGVGRCPWRPHCHTTTTIGATYSISSAGPTGSRSIAKK